MNVIPNDKRQEAIAYSTDKRTWIWAVCRTLLDRFPNPLKPPQEPVYTANWKEFQEGLRHNIKKHLRYLTFKEIENEWKVQTQTDRPSLKGCATLPNEVKGFFFFLLFYKTKYITSTKQNLKKRKEKKGERYGLQHFD